MTPNPIIWAILALAPGQHTVSVELEPVLDDWLASLIMDGEPVAEAQATTPDQAMADLEDRIRELEQKWR